MFYALGADPTYWNTKVNLFVALAPVTRLHNTTCELFKVSAKFITPIKDAFYLTHIYSLLGAGSAVLTKIACGLVP